MGCEGDEVCVGEQPDDFDDRLCVYRSGSHTCGSVDGYPERFTRYEDVTDDRDCSKCSCDLDGDDCVGEVKFYDVEDCDGAPRFSLEMPSVCKEPSASKGLLSFDISGWVPPCDPDGGNATGEADFEDIVTFCCTD